MNSGRGREKLAVGGGGGGGGAEESQAGPLCMKPWWVLGSSIKIKFVTVTEIFLNNVFYSTLIKANWLQH